MDPQFQLEEQWVLIWEKLGQFVVIQASSADVNVGISRKEEEDGIANEFNKAKAKKGTINKYIMVYRYDNDITDNGWN